jgi:hypothetical protein
MPMRQRTSALGRLMLAGLFAVAPRLFVTIAVHGLAHDTGAPRTLFAITHKRDLDAFAPLPRLLGHRGWRALTSDVHFAMRADSFQPGFLARVVQHPGWFARLLRPISVGPVLRAVGVHPLDSLHFRPAETWLREALIAEGDVALGTLLAPDALASIAAAAGDDPAALAQRPLSALLAWRYFRPLQRQLGSELFRGPARRRAEARVLASAKRQLAELAAWLRAGGSVYTSPEGRLSPDGRLGPVRAGMLRLLRAAPADTRVLPIAIVYDFMTTGRPRMWVDCAPALEGGAQLTARELESRVRAAWLAAARFTCTQLATGLLVQSREKLDSPVRAEELAAGVRAWAAQLAASGRHVDPRLLSEAGARRRVGRYLRYAERRGLLRRHSAAFSLVPGALSLPDAAATSAAPADADLGYRSSPLQYAWAEAEEMLGLRVPAPS